MPQLAWAKTVKVLLHFPGLRGQVRTLTAVATDAWGCSTSGEAAAKTTFASAAFITHISRLPTVSPLANFGRSTLKLVAQHEFKSYRQSTWRRKVAACNNALALVEISLTFEGMKYRIHLISTPCIWNTVGVNILLIIQRLGVISPSIVNLYLQPSKVTKPHFRKYAY
jgi:hypothetical protein